MLLDAETLSTGIQQAGYQNRDVLVTVVTVWRERVCLVFIIVLGMCVTVMCMSVIHCWMWHIACS